jgi:phytol kinase
MLSLGDLVGLLLVYLYVAAVITVAVYAKKRYPGCSYRKLIHILIGNIVFLWWVFDSRYVMAFLAAAPFVIMLLLVTPYSPIKRFQRSFLCDASSQGHGLGLVYYAVSWTILAFLLFDDRMIASIAIVSMSYGDGLGGWIGKKYGGRKLWGNKSMVGTAAVFLGTVLATIAIIAFYGFLGGYIPSLNVTFLSPPFVLGVAVLTGAFVSVVELFSPGEYDNIIVPFSTAAMLLLLGL